MTDLRARAERVLDGLSLLLADVRDGLGAFLAVYLLTVHAWDEATIGLTLSIAGLAGLLSQVPIGLTIDAVRQKRALLAAATAVVTVTCFAIPLAPTFWPVVAALVLGAVAGTVIGPTLAAISLGVVGRERFPERIGRNEALFHAGNAGVTVLVLVSAPALGQSVVFWVLGLSALASVGMAFAIPERAIDHDLARGLLAGGDGRREKPAAWSVLLASPPLIAFALTGVLFHLANASMLGLVSQKLALLVPDHAITLTAACVIAAQLVMVPTAALAGARADRWGRKPLLLAAFVALALRGALYTVSDHPAWLVGVQLLDGIGAGLVGALFPVVVADLTRGSGHFAAAQGAVGTVHGIGGVISATLAGQIIVRAGYDAAFLTLATVAAVGAVLFLIVMPETKGLPELGRGASPVPARPG